MSSRSNDETASASARPSSSSLEASLREDLASVVRVRNRLSALAADDDDGAKKLSRVLASPLLHRLLRRLDDNAAAFVEERGDDASTVDCNSSRNSSSQEIRRCRQHIITHVAGTLSHVADRIRLSLLLSRQEQRDGGDKNKNSNVNDVDVAAYVGTLLPHLREYKSKIARSTALDLIRIGLPRYGGSGSSSDIGTDKKDDDGDKCDGSNTTTSDGGGGGAGELPLAAAIRYLLPLADDDDAYYCSETAAAAGAQRDGDGGEEEPPATTTTAEATTTTPTAAAVEFRHSASWLLLSAVAQSYGMPSPFDNDSADDETKFPSWERLQSPSTATSAITTSVRCDVSHAERPPSGGTGLFYLFLDVLLYRPSSSTTPSPAVGFRGGGNRRPHQDENLPAADVVAFGTTGGLSLDGLALLQHPGGSGGGDSGRTSGISSSSSWNDVYLQQLKYVCLKYAIGDGAPVSSPQQKKKTASSTMTTSNRQSGLFDGDRALLLAVLMEGTSSMHGRLASNYMRQYYNDALLKKAKAGNWSSSNTGATTTSPAASSTSVFEVSTSLACCLLILVLGDDAATPVLNKYADQRRLWEGILGCHLTKRSFRHRRTPLPVDVASRAVTFIRDHFHLQREEFAAYGDDGTNTAARRGIQLFIELVVAVQDPNRHGVYWGIQLMQGLFDDLRKVAAENGQFRDNGWVQDFYKCCLETAKSVLLVVPEQHNNIGDYDGRLGNRGRGDHDGQPLGVPEPFDRRNDLNQLLRNHRLNKKKRLLNMENAIHARRVAYAMIAELSSFICLESDASKDDALHLKNLGICKAVFNWSSIETEANQVPLQRALDALLKHYRMILCRSDNDPGVHEKQQLVAPLLPCLLLGASSDSPFGRQMVARWAGELLSYADPDAALHICSFLANDPEFSVSTLVKTSLKRLRKDRPYDFSASCAYPAVEFYNTSEFKDRAKAAQDLGDRSYALMVEFDLTRDESYTVLYEHNFSVATASAALRTDRTNTLNFCGLLNSADDSVPMDTDSAYVCGICYDDELSTMDSYSLGGCHHVFCRDCWSSYLENAFDISNSNAAVKLTCPHHECAMRVLPPDIRQIDEKYVAMWNERLFQAFLLKSENYRSCPGPDCSTVARCESPSIAAIECPDCSTSFCFRCGCKPHEPAACDSYEQWYRIFTSDFWVKKNSKPCPSCHAPIEKNQGCNHMTCSQCSAQFCWLCLSPMSGHFDVHVCNRYDPINDGSVAVDDDDRRALFFTARYDAHDEAEAAARRQLRELLEGGDRVAAKLRFASAADVDTLQDAVRSLAKARSFLKFSYVAAWATRDVSFETSQATLESVTERLNYMTERNLETIFYEQGRYGVDLHFRALEFHASSVNEYMSRMTSIMADKEQQKR